MAKKMSLYGSKGPKSCDIGRGTKIINIFYAKTQNTFCLLQNDMGEWVEGHKMEELVNSYFQPLFIDASFVGQMDFLEQVWGKVTGFMNIELSKHCTAAQVFSTPQQMHHTKAPNSNGMPPIFFPKYWHIGGQSITEIVLRLLNSGKVPNDLNHTFITMIPRKKL